MFVEAIRLGTGQLTNTGTAPLELEKPIDVSIELGQDLYRAPPPPEPPPVEPLLAQIWATPSLGQGRELMVHFKAIVVSGRPSRYEWDFGDGDRDFGGWASTIHTYRSRYETVQTRVEHFRARLVVRDELGQESSATHLITLWVPGTGAILI